MPNHVLDLYLGAAKYVSLAYGGNHGIRGEFAPQTPDLSEAEFSALALKDGADLLYSSMQNVTESATILFSGDSTDNLRAAIRSVETFFAMAKLNAITGRGNKAYVHFQPGGSGTVYRSQILSGKVQPTAFIDYAFWKGYKAECVVTWQRRFYWETTSVSALTISNGGGSGASVTIYNHDDAAAGHDNYVEIAAAQVTGAIPTPAIVQLRHSLNGGATITSVLAGHWIKTGASWPTHILEEASGYTSLEDGTAGNVCSGSGTYGQFARKTLPTSEDDLLYWTLNAADLNIWLGAPFRIVARFAAAVPSGTKTRLQIRNGSDVLWQQNDLIVLSTGQLQELGTVCLPPGLPGIGVNSNSSLYLRGLNASAGNLDLDFLMLFPLDSFHVLQNIGTGVVYQQYLYSDGWRNLAYSATTGNLYRPDYIMLGQPLYLMPGVDNRLYLLMNAAAAPVSLTATVAVSIYPRRLTV